MAKEIKVFLYAGENDSYTELWKVVDEEKYYGRYTYKNEGTWYYVCDPLGYCELDHTVNEDVTFIVCNSDGTELFRSSNGSMPFPKFETVVKKKWNEIKKYIPHNAEDLSANFWAEAWNGDTTMKINQWLLSYKDPDLYPEKANDYDENWTGCWAEKEIEYEPIPNSEFEYLGNKYQFTKVTHRHDYCHIEWTEFVCTDSPYMLQDTPWVKDRKWISSYMYMGNSFDDTSHGTMYDKRTARNLVVERLKKTFPPKEYGSKAYSDLLYVNVKGNTCQKMSYSDVADLLIGRDLHRKNVDHLCKFIKKETDGKIYANNTGNRHTIKSMYPNIYAFDYCV